MHAFLFAFSLSLFTPPIYQSKPIFLSSNRKRSGHAFQSILSLYIGSKFSGEDKNTFYYIFVWPDTTMIKVSKNKYICTCMNRFWHSKEIFWKYEIKYNSELDLRRNDTTLWCVVCTFHKNMRLIDLGRAQHYRHTQIKCIRIANLLKNAELLFHCMRHITSHRSLSKKVHQDYVTLHN